MLHERKGQLAKGYRECSRDAFTAEYVVRDTSRLYDNGTKPAIHVASVCVCRFVGEQKPDTYFPPLCCMLYMHPFWHRQDTTTRSDDVQQRKAIPIGSVPEFTRLIFEGDK